jgi:hypothetical protein
MKFFLRTVGIPEHQLRIEVDLCINASHEFDPYYSSCDIICLRSGANIINYGLFAVIYGTK